MKITNRLNKLEQKSNLQNKESRLMSLELWKEHYEGKDILPKLNEKQKQNWLKCEEIGNKRVAEVLARCAERSNS